MHTWFDFTMGSDTFVEVKKNQTLRLFQMFVMETCISVVHTFITDCNLVKKRSFTARSVTSTLHVSYAHDKYQL